MIKKFFHRILVLCSLVFIVAILIAYLSVYVSPNTFVFPAFCGLAYPYLLLINFIFFIYWLYRKRWSALLPLLAILFGWGYFSQYFGFSINSGEIITKEFKVMSYNVRYFNRYNWNKDPEAAQNMLDVVIEEDVDIVCFQEFLVRKNEGITLDVLKKKFSDLPFYYINDKGNLAIFSRYEIVKSEDIKFSKEHSGSCFFSDIKSGSETLRIYNCHLESNRFSKEDYDFINNLKKNAEEQNIEGAKGITKRLAHAFKKRSIQADIIRNKLGESPKRHIICGDFNDSPISYSYYKIKGNLIDSFTEKGCGLGSTYIGDFPSFRIDYIFYTNDLECISFKKIKQKFSDHYPIITSIKKDF